MGKKNFVFDGRVIGSDRFMRDGTNGRLPWFYLHKLDSWALSLIRIVGKVELEVRGTWWGV